jgi:Rod binding domain-containing protein
MTPLMPSLASPPLSSIASPSLAAAGAKNSPQARMRAQAQDFEAQFLNTMFQQMYTGVGGDGPFGNSTGVGPWRSFLTDEYAKSFAKQGGIGIGDAVYKQMLARYQAHQVPTQTVQPAQQTQPTQQPQALAR